MVELILKNNDFFNNIPEIIETENVISYYIPEIIKGKYGKSHIISSIVSLDSSEKYIKYSSFEFSEYILNYNKLLNEIKNINTTYQYYEGFLLTNNEWSINFSHMLNETMPRILTYIKLKSFNQNLKLIVHKNLYFDWMKDIFNLFNINSNNIIILEIGNVYKIKKLYSQKICFGISIPNEELKVNFYNNLRLKLHKNLLVESNKSPNIVYLVRNDEHKIGICNKARYIENNKVLIEYLEKYNINLVGEFSKKNIIDKAKSLYNADIIITQMGANLMNLLFTNNPKFLVILYSDNFFTNYHENLLNNLNDNKVTVIYIKCKDANSGNINSPIILDLDLFKNKFEYIYKQILSK